MPWKAEKDPYRIWLSEIILQQTRVDQGWTYYENFIRSFPDVFALARAPEKKVFKLWEGLGYYNRCRNLIETAKKIVRDYQGHFPPNYDRLRELKGIGPYTAAAIASFAFNLPYAVLDGNVQRIISRYFGITTPMGSSAGKKLYTELATALMDPKDPGTYNQAMMDFGATICKPQNPLCVQCVQSADCAAFQNGWVADLPVKEKRTAKKTRWFYYFLVETRDQRIYIRRRDNQDIWKNLYEFILWESKVEISNQELADAFLVKKILQGRKFNFASMSKPYRQVLSHQVIHVRFISVRIQQPIPGGMEGYRLVRKKSVGGYPFSKVTAAYLGTVE
jgi:A/G-specific adenine glycosylase